VKILIAGLGSIGRRHLRNLAALGEKDIVLYRTHHSTLPDADLARFPVETDLQKALERKPDAVVIANPTSLHLDVAIPAALAGCHLLLEKPVSDTLERVPQLQQALADGGGQALVGFQFRFHPGLQKTRQILESGILGQVVSARAHWGEYLPDWHVWEDYRQSYAARADLGGGVVRTLCHPLDYFRWLFGEVASVWAFTGSLGNLDLEVEDTAEIGLRCASGCLGSVQVNYVQRPPVHKLEIIGTQGSLRWDNADGAVQLYRVREQPAWEVFPAPPGFERNHMFVAQMAHFLEVARGKAQPVCTLEDGIQAQSLVDAVYRSAQEGQCISL
jgi:predicted dehydrogenase